MVRRFDIDNELFVGFDRILQIPQVDAITNQPINANALGSWFFELRSPVSQVISDLVISGGDIAFSTSAAAAAISIANDVVEITVGADMTMNAGSGAILLQGKFAYTLYVIIGSYKVAAAYGDCWIRLIGGRF